MEMIEAVEEVLMREGGRGRERAVSKVEITLWREERTCWRVRREARGSGSVAGLEAGAVRAVEISAGDLRPRGVIGDVTSTAI